MLQVRLNQHAAIFRRMSSPKVTVGMPAYNRAEVLRSTIEQILKQSFRDFELIIYNDGSKDNTSEVVLSFEDDRILFLDNSINVGPPHPLNEILRHARGEYIIIVHDHDIFHPQLIEFSVEALEKHPTAGFVLQGCAWIDEDGLSNYQPLLLNLPEYNHGREHGLKMLENSESFSSIFHACCMVRRRAHEKAGFYYEESFGLNADVDLWLRLLLTTDFVYMNEVFYKFRTRERVGHFLNEKGYEIAAWNYAIHEINICRYFPAASLSKDNLLSNAKNMFRKQIRSVALKYALNNMEQLFVKGLHMLMIDNDRPVEKYLFSAAIKLRFLRISFILILGQLNKTRKWISS